MRDLGRSLRVFQERLLDTLERGVAVQRLEAERRDQPRQHAVDHVRAILWSMIAGGSSLIADRIKASLAELVVKPSAALFVNARR